VLSANGLSNVIPISSRKVERWDTWTNAKVVIGKSNGAGANKTEFNRFNINIISVIIPLIFKVSGFKGKCSATKAEFIPICVIPGNRKTYPTFVSSNPLSRKIVVIIVISINNWHYA
jgi:hypothetical protein